MSSRCALLALVVLQAASLQQDSCLPQSEGSSFSTCCQFALPGEGTGSEVLCGATTWDCSRLWACQEERLIAGVEDSANTVGDAGAVLDTTRGPVRLPEMQIYFETMIFPYITLDESGGALASDPVFLDIEHVLPAILLTLAAEATSVSELVFFDVGAFEGAVGLAALALWDAILATAPSWPAMALPLGTPPLSQISRARLRVVAVEPDPDRCKVLDGSQDMGSSDPSKRDDLNRTQLSKLIDGRLTAVCAAAGIVDGASQLRCPDGHHCYVAEQVMESLSVKGDLDSETVRMVTVDSIAREDNVGDIAVLKIDAEGSDFEVLRGAQGLLSERRVRFVIVEVSVLWEHRRSAQSGRPVQKAHLQLPEFLDYLAEVGDYACFLLGPEVLIPLSGPWLGLRYIHTEHQFNLLCAVRDDPALQSVIRLYSVSPRATQFSLAALPPAGKGRPECWACAVPALGDASLRRDAAAAERYFAAIYSRVDLKGWGLPHVHFMRARWLQATGRAQEAWDAWTELSATCCHEPASFQASREVFQLQSRYVASLSARAVLLRDRNATARFAVKKPFRKAAENALQLAWVHQRPGGGSVFRLDSACVAEDWFLQSARAGHEGGAFFAGLALQYGECSGKMTRGDLWLAKVWYDRSKRFQAQFVERGGEVGMWALFSSTVADLAQDLLAEAAYLN